MQAQQSIGYIEQFALAEDRREALQDLIPETDEYFFYHCLHYQNEKQLAEAEAVLKVWRDKVGETPLVQRMLTRQRLLAYQQNPEQTLEYLTTRLNLQLNHAPPSKDQAASLASSLDNRLLAFERRLEQILARDQSLSQIEDAALPALLGRKLSSQQLRALLSRLRRADDPLVVPRIAEELALRDSKGFGWAKIHSLLTLDQLQALLKQRPNLVESSNFVAAYSSRLAPPTGVSLTDRSELRSYLGRLRAWTSRLPESQNSLKALVLGNLLKLDLASEKFDKGLFQEYLALPRSTSYYNQELLRKRVTLSQLDFAFAPHVLLPAVGDDSLLVRQYLEHFLRSAENVDDFARWLDRDYLERVFAETKILYGVGNNRSWYAKLSPEEQRSLRERVEIGFAPHNPTHFKPDAQVQLEAEIKNVEELVVRVYEINTAAYARNSNKPVNTDIDLDGLVANFERKLEFAEPAERRHLERLEFPEMQGRGVWVVDLLGGGRRSRALIRKGELIAVERLGDAGHVLQILDEAGSPVPDAHIEFGGRKYSAEHGNIVIPYAEQRTQRSLLLVHGDFASEHTLSHRAENYQLEARFLLDHQSLVAGSQARIAVETRLYCNNVPISIQLLESPALTITSTDADGIQTSQSIESLDLQDGDELVHTFLVPQRLRSLQFELGGSIHNQSRGIHEDLSANHSLTCNGIEATAQIGDFYLQQPQSGYRLLVLGRNGEPVQRLPVSIQLKDRHFKSRQTFTLATNAQGMIELGKLEAIESLTANAQAMQAITFTPTSFHRKWPTTLNAEENTPIQLALGESGVSPSQFSLHELRNEQTFSNESPKLNIDRGMLQLQDLRAGDYLLRDHDIGQAIRIRVERGELLDQHIVGANRVFEKSNLRPVVIRRTQIVDGKLEVEVDNADPMTRLHVVVDAFFPEELHAKQLELPVTPRMSRTRSPLESYYINSLRLDEEYSYILNRKNSDKYPGNLLPQPSLLIQPWEVSATENERQEAKKGDRLDAMAEEAPASPDMRPSPASEAGRNQANWKCYNFLASGSAVLTNIGLVDGKVSLPIDEFAGLTSISLIAVHPTSVDSRLVALPDAAVESRDLRLQAAFSPDQHLTKTQRVEFLAADAPKSLGDPRTRRLKTYSTISEVFQLYGTILNNPEWEKFRPLVKWPSLSPQEQENLYNELACHELNFFLYLKDPQFFERVVEPQIRQKLDRQLIDLWLLGEPIDSFAELWRYQRLNALERVLLARQMEASKAGTLRWLHEYVLAHPRSPESENTRFDYALNSAALDSDAVVLGEELMRAASPRGLVRGRGGRASGQGAYGGGEGEAQMDASALLSKSLPQARSLRENGLGAQQEFNDFFGVDRLGRARGQGLPGFFQSLDSTKEWAESQYYQIRIAAQGPDLVPPNRFWEQYLAQDHPVFLPQELDVPVSNLSEALFALAVIDLPFESTAPKITVRDDNLLVEVEHPTVLFLESIEECAESKPSSVLVGQDIYLAAPDTSENVNRPVQAQPLLARVPYRTHVVVTNPSNEKQRLQVLTQIPAGAMPLTGGKITRSSTVELGPYSTTQVQYYFYFPEAGKYEHYGAQISQASHHLTHTESTQLQVLSEPESVDENTWAYVADWGSNAEVLRFLQSANLQQLELSRIAFRMQDKDFYSSVKELLSASGQFDSALWAYAIAHRDLEGMEQLLQNHDDLLQELGAAFDSPLIQYRPQEQMSYEHLDYKPLVVARTHRLGPDRKILNPSLHQHYHQLLEVLAHQAEVSNDQQMQLCYYLLLQNRISEALQRFAKIQPELLHSEIQYVYLDAYLDFFRGNYERSAQLASQYMNHPVPRWRSLFREISQQVNERVALLRGEPVETLVSSNSGGDKDQRLLTDGRLQQQTEQARKTPTLEMSIEDDQIAVEYSNLESLQVNYYQMDIELLFSRKPFVGQDRSTSPFIKPNVTETLQLESPQGTKSVALPRELRNKNVLVEIVSEGIARSSVVTANSLQVEVASAFGQLQVLAEQGRAPVEGAYVKIYARHQNGTVRFFKDGYTDLRGRFDYATLSTNDLDTCQRFSILVLDRELGAVVRETAPPIR